MFIISLIHIFKSVFSMIFNKLTVTGIYKLSVFTYLLM